MGRFVAAALAGTVASLRAGRLEMAGPYMQATCFHPDDRAALSQAPPAEAPCDELIPRYAMDEWMSAHPGELPDHPAIFVGTHTKEKNFYQTEKRFLKEFGSTTVFALPEYAQRESHLHNPNAEGAVNASLESLARIWSKSGYLSYSDLRCRDSVCRKLSRKYSTPRVFWGNTTVTTLHVGGPGSGTPFHKHAMLWKGLTMGKKAWYILPPGSMSEAMHDFTGPNLFPVRTFHGMMQTRKVGQRPLYCVQTPGETMFIPNYWWHATMNMEHFQVAYGGSAMSLPQQQGSRTKEEILKIFPMQDFDDAGWSANSARPLSGKPWPMPYAIAARRTWMRRTCGHHVGGPRFGLEEPLQRIKSLSGSRMMDCLQETAAYIHCALARSLEEILDNDKCQTDLHLRTLRVFAMQWLGEARALSSSLVQREPTICRRMRPKAAGAEGAD